jgi:HPt (histidine-containing phosphotransfer) domain-containing protein
MQHAQWIEYFKEKVEQGAILFSEDNTRTYTLKTFLAHVHTILGDARAKKITLLSALSLTASIEDSLIERKVFDHFNSDSQELRTLIARLMQETRTHAAEIKKLRLKYSNATGGVR